MRQAITAPDGAPALGPYSPAVRAGNLLFLSGQIPLNPATGKLVEGGIEPQTDQVMRNIGALLRAAGVSFDQLVRTTVFMSDLNDFDGMNTVYAKYVGTPPPTRATVQVARLPRDVRIEIDAIAMID
jgi:2-iminobutanoate/2-iminopropanoate deaminase